MASFKRPDFFNGISTLEVEELRSAFMRSTLLIGFFLVGLLVSIFEFFFMGNKIVEFYGVTIVYFTTLPWLLGILIYEVIILRVLKNKMRKKQRISTGLKILSTFIEVSLPSAILAHGIFSAGVPLLVDSPFNYLYFLFIILSILHLDFRVSILSGIIASLEFSLIVHFAFKLPQMQSHMLSVPENLFYVRGVILLLASCAAAFVAYEMQHRVALSIEAKKEKEEIELMFDQQVSKEVSKALMERKGATQRLEATVMFLDIRNFTAFADSHTPDDVIDYQNKFISPVIDIINQHQGVVFQILGDGLMACFGSPVENVLHADMAFHASNRILTKIKELSEANAIPHTRIGIGLHCGPLVAGNIGNQQRKQFSVSGTPVIVASRLEQLNKKFNTEFLISEQVLKNISQGNTKISFLAEETLRGIELPLRVHKVEW